MQFGRFSDDKFNQIKLQLVKLGKRSSSDTIKRWNRLKKKEAEPGLPTCTKSIITGVHFREVSVDGGALSGVISAVQTAMADCVKITAVWREITERGIV